MKRFPELDGLRGLAALFVVLAHAWWFSAPSGFSGPLKVATTWLDHGRGAVSVFIVLSGFLLMMPVARDGAIRGGVPGFLKRRARRILPPYYAALAFSLALIAVCPSLRRTNDPAWAVALPALEPRAIAAHVLLVHNMRPWWTLTINPPMWSVATEWQIYFAFPVLVWLWRRVGMGLTVALAFLVGLLPFAVAPRLAGEFQSPWYIGLFAIGMAGAASVFDQDDRVRPPLRPWLVTAVGFLCVCLARGYSRVDALVGACAVALVVWLVRESIEGPRPGADWILRMLRTRPVRALGACSYSLYLFHDPLLALASAELIRRNVPHDLRFALLAGVVAPAGVLFAWLMHFVVEKPFLGHARSPVRREAELAAVP